MSQKHNIYIYVYGVYYMKIIFTDAKSLEYYHIFFNRSYVEDLIIHGTDDGKVYRRELVGFFVDYRFDNRTLIIKIIKK